MRRLRFFFLLCLMVATLAVPGVSGARAAEHAAAGDLIPLEQVFASLRQTYSGDKLDARIRQGANATYYEVHWLTADGRKLVFMVNARTGAIEETRGSAGEGG